MEDSWGDYEFHYFEQLRPWDLFASSSFVVLATAGILLNLCALSVVLKNKNLSTIIKSYLFTDHLCRIIAQFILFYPATCAFVRIADVAPELYEISAWFDSPDFLATNRTYTPICVAWRWTSMWSADLNQVLAVAFNTIMYFLELLQLAISTNRWLAISFGGRYHHVLRDTWYLQIELMLTTTWIAFYKYSLGNRMYFDGFSYSLLDDEYLGYTHNPNGEVLEAIRIISVVITLISILLDWSTFVLLKRHLENSRQLTQSDAKTGADIRLAKQLLINHLYSIFVATCNCYMLIIFSPVDSLSLSDDDPEPLKQENELLTKTSWFIFLATTLFPALGNVVNGLLTIIFLSPPREKTIVSKTRSFLTDNTSAQDDSKQR